MLYHITEVECCKSINAIKTKVDTFYWWLKKTFTKFSWLDQEKDEKNNKAFVETNLNLEKSWQCFIVSENLSTKTQRNNEVVSCKGEKLSLIADRKNMPLIFQ